MAEWKFGFRRVQKKIKTKIKYILHTIKKTTSLTLSVYLCFNNVGGVNITWRHYRWHDSKLAECMNHKKFYFTFFAQCWFSVICNRRFLFTSKEKIPEMKCSVHTKAVLDDSWITVGTTTLHQHKLYYCTITLICHIVNSTSCVIRSADHQHFTERRSGSGNQQN